jgi:hypothetical protein
MAIAYAGVEVVAIHRNRYTWVLYGGARQDCVVRYAIKVVLVDHIVVLIFPVLFGRIVNRCSFALRPIPLPIDCCPENMHA